MSPFCVKGRLFGLSGVRSNGGCLVDGGRLFRKIGVVGDRFSVAWGIKFQVVYDCQEWCELSLILGKGWGNMVGESLLDFGHYGCRYRS